MITHKKSFSSPVRGYLRPQNLIKGLDWPQRCVRVCLCAYEGRGGWGVWVPGKRGKGSRKSRPQARCVVACGAVAVSPRTYQPISLSYVGVYLSLSNCLSLVPSRAAISALEDVRYRWTTPKHRSNHADFADFYVSGGAGGFLAGELKAAQLFDGWTTAGSDLTVRPWTQHLKQTLELDLTAAERQDSNFLANEVI